MSRCFVMALRWLILFTFTFGVVKAQNVDVWAKDGLAARLNTQNDTVYVFNFWATWCKPCLEELPEFKAAQQHWSGKTVRFIYLSLDFMSKRESILLPYVAKSMNWAKVIQLDAGDPNHWIPWVDSTWSGAIPATLIWSAKGRAFYEESLRAPQINSIVQSLMP